MINLESGMPRVSWNAHKGLVYTLAFTPDGVLASAASDGTLKYWDVSSGKEQRPPSPTNAFVALSPDGKLVAVSDAGQGGRGEVDLKDIAAGKKIRSVKVEKPPKGMMAITIDRRELAFIQGGFSAGASALALSPDGRVLATAGSSVTLWDLTTGKQTAVLRGNSDAIAALAFSPDGRLVAAGGLDHVVKIFEAGSGKELRTLSGHKNVVNAVAFSPDGRRLATGSWDNTIKIWEVETGREVLTVAMKWLWEVVKARMVECSPKTSSGAGAA
jgi:WD40 repeat protein